MLGSWISSNSTFASTPAEGVGASDATTPALWRSNAGSAIVSASVSSTNDPGLNQSTWSVVGIEARTSRRCGLASLPSSNVSTASPSGTRF